MRILFFLALAVAASLAIIAVQWLWTRLPPRAALASTLAMVAVFALGLAWLLGYYDERGRGAAPTATDGTDWRDSLAAVTYGGIDGLSFSDITTAAGTGGPGARGRTGGHGAFWADLDGSGVADLLITMGARQTDPTPDLLFRNLGTGRFVEEARLRGISGRGGTHGACFADLDNDGHYDLFTGAAWEEDGSSGVNRLYRNDGRGHFADVTEAAGLLAGTSRRTGAVLCFDVNGNGYLDLLALSAAVGTPDPEHPGNEVYLNGGNMRFEVVTSGALVDAAAGQGAIDTDFNGNGFIDLLAANPTGPMLILANDGEGRFTSIEPESLGINHRAGYGISSADVNNNGHLDLLLSGPEGVHLYLGNGDGTFAHRQSFNVNRPVHMGGFADLTNNGYVDLVLSGVDRVYLNDGQGRFEPGPTLVMRDVSEPRAVAFADINGNGAVDIKIAASDSANRLFRNNLERGNWLKVALISPQGQAGAFGARVHVYAAGDAGGRLLGMREARSNQGYLAQDDPVLHFGLDQVAEVDVVVRFLDGTEVIRRAATTGQTLVIDGRGERP